MKSAHTPGPWIVESDGSTVAMGDQCVITSPAPDGASRATECANARLIASAPDMLAALEAVEAAQRSGDYGTAFAAVSAALKLVRGEALNGKVPA